MAIVIMIIIGLANESNLWLYMALGVSVLAKLSVVAKATQAQVQAKEQTQDLINNLFKSIQAKNN